MHAEDDQAMAEAMVGGLRMRAWAICSQLPYSDLFRFILQTFASS